MSIHLYAAKMYSLGSSGTPLYSPKPHVAVANQIEKVICAREHRTGPMRHQTGSLNPLSGILIGTFHH
jgi:hypothetical protein